MSNVTKDDVIYGLARLQNFVQDLDEDEFEEFTSGLPLCSRFMPHDWMLARNGTHTRKVCHLEMRLK